MTTIIFCDKIYEGSIQFIKIIIKKICNRCEDWERKSAILQMRSINAGAFFIVIIVIDVWLAKKIHKQHVLISIWDDSTLLFFTQGEFVKRGRAQIIHIFHREKTKNEEQIKNETI